MKPLQALRLWHRQSLEAYPSHDPPIWPLLWQIPEDAGPVRVLAEALLTIVVLCLYVGVPLGIGYALYLWM